MRYVVAMIVCIFSLFAKEKNDAMTKKPIIIMETTQGTIELEN